MSSATVGSTLPQTMHSGSIPGYVGGSAFQSDFVYSQKLSSAPPPSPPSPHEYELQGHAVLHAVVSSFFPGTYSTSTYSPTAIPTTAAAAEAEAAVAEVESQLARMQGIAQLLRAFAGSDKSMCLTLSMSLSLSLSLSMFRR